eukprot:gnl/Dysnectes_brevis/1067_a1189_2571.p1 GENE.gnl/Dysnectes_brevis/1067_a1189_2571~~gnl/Dysnectes_brevis/1067_a1189_2571.p1  ORF type:complete len:317 (+),score=132.92 gnl/Dysnectes_brevis/1067_a1189_2571:747-1697(+)
MSEFTASEVLFALSMSFIAGAATSIGAAIVFFTKGDHNDVKEKRFLSFILGFSAGMMIHISYAELLAETHNTLASIYSEQTANLIATLSFFGGIFVIALIDFLVPPASNPHDLHAPADTPGQGTGRAEQAHALRETRPPAEDTRVMVADAIAGQEQGQKERAELHRLGVISGILVFIHNWPEGIATFVVALQSSASMTAAVTGAIFLHNIPEGVSVSVPLLYSTGSKRKAFWYASLSGLAEPLGALVAWLFLMPILNDTVLAVVLAATGGIMVFISLDELLPAAQRYGLTGNREGHIATWGLLLGMAVMAATLVVL